MEDILGMPEKSQSLENNHFQGFFYPLSKKE